MKYVIFLLLLLPITLFAQKHDYNWFAGEYDPPPGPPSNFVLDFNTYPPTYVGLETNYSYWATLHSMSDADGKFLYYSNGCSLWQWIDGENIPVTTGLNPGDYYCQLTSISGMVLVRGVLTLPMDNNQYFMFSYEMYPVPGNPCLTKKFIYHVFDASSSPGTVTSQANVLKESCFSLASATRHANGRDWWIVVPEIGQHRFFVWLLTPSGLVEYPEQIFVEASPWVNLRAAHTEFSPNGNFIVLSYYKKGVGLYRFDRCTGTMSNFEMVHEAADFNGTLSFSPNSQYLYLADSNVCRLSQYDVTAPDIAATRTLVSVDCNYFDTLAGSYSYFAQQQNGPDGKLYIWAGDTHFMHVMDFPNRAGAACRLRQRALELESYTFRASAYYPNYRLGPIDGSGCDTLGINNVPMAMYHYDIEDTLAPRAITFTDASYYEPAEWYWTFGDGNSSTVQNPVHTYAAGGVYTACLVVKNTNGADTLCRTIQVSNVSGTTEPAVLPQAMVLPNPVQSQLRVVLPARVPGITPWFRLTNAMGREVLSAPLTQFDQTWPVDHIPAGIYFWEVQHAGRIWSSGKIIKVM
jgi:PKD repeat protein